MAEVETASDRGTKRHVKNWTCGVMSDGVVAAVVAKFELEGAASAGLAQDLVAHTDAKDGLLAKQGLGGVHCIGHSRGVSLHKQCLMVAPGSQKVQQLCTCPQTDQLFVSNQIKESLISSHLPCVSTLTRGVVASWHSWLSHTDCLVPRPHPSPHVCVLKRRLSCQDKEVHMSAACKGRIPGSCWCLQLTPPAW